MTITLFDPEVIRKNLLPFTFTRPIAEIRVGILTISEKWKKSLNCDVGYVTEGYLQKLFPKKEGEIFIRSNILPNPELVKAVKSLQPGQGLFDSEGVLMACSGKDEDFISSDAIEQTHWAAVTFKSEYIRIDQLWHIFSFNSDEIVKDYQLLTADRKSHEVNDPFTRCYNKAQVFIEEGASFRSNIFNAEEGPIYIGRNAQVQEGAIIQGPFAMLDNSVINLGAKIRKGVSIGPYCKIGGEISNSVIFGFSNKAHDGFLGNSVIGHWCNIGADSNTSNLKNNYGEIKVWNYGEERFVNTGLQFCGLMMGDHSKCAINTMFNTGTVVGVAANIFGAGFPRTMVPSFSWGGSGGYKTHQFKKTMEAEIAMMKRREKELTPEYENMLCEVFDLTAKFRIWEKAEQ